MGKFIVSARNGNYIFVFIAGNGELIANSLPHITKSSANRALQETIRSAGSKHLYQKIEQGFQYYFELRNEAGTQLMISEKFGSEESRDYAMNILLREAMQAESMETIL